MPRRVYRRSAIESTRYDASFAVEHLGGPTEFAILQRFATQLEHTALRRQIALEHADVMVRLGQRASERAHDILLAKLGERRYIPQILRQGFARHRHDIAIQKAVAEEFFHDHGHAANLVQ